MFARTHAGSVFAVSGLVFTAAVETETPAEVEVELRRLGTVWEDVVRSKDVSKIIAFYSDDSYLLRNGKPFIIGKKALIEEWKRLLAQPNYQSAWKPTHIEVAKSLDMAFEIGTLVRSMTDPNGKVISAPGKYVVVWRKEADGKWRVAVDAPSADGQ